MSFRDAGAIVSSIAFAAVASGLAVGFTVGCAVLMFGWPS